MPNEAAALSAERITEYLPEALKRFEIIVADSVGSTNACAREAAALGKRELLIVASRQSSGRGTKGRNFFSPSGGLYMSALLRPRASAEAAALLTPAAAVAVCSAAEALGSAPLKIKWVNDIMLGGKKVCGILIEASFGAAGALDYAVVGIGVNITPPEGGFPDEVARVAGALFENTPRFARERLAAGILARLVPMCAALSERAFVEEYRRRDFLEGKRVRVITPRGERTALALGTDDACRLLVRYDDGRNEALSSGEVSVRPCGI